jgi:hypothetical protein
MSRQRLKIPAKVQKVLKRYKAKFKYRDECSFCGEDTLMVFEDYTGTWDTCVNPKCVRYGDLSYFPKKGGR